MFGFDLSKLFGGGVGGASATGMSTPDLLQTGFGGDFAVDPNAGIGHKLMNQLAGPQNFNRNMGIASGLLEAGGWSKMPVSNAEAMGMGLKGGMAGKELDQWEKVRRMLAQGMTPRSADPYAQYRDKPETAYASLNPHVAQSLQPSSIPYTQEQMKPQGIVAGEFDNPITDNHFLRWMQQR